MSKGDFLKRIRVKLTENEENMKKEETIEGVRVVFTGKKEIMPSVATKSFYQMRYRI